MEELKNITSKETHDGENITIEEIQKIDKNLLVENLSNLEPASKNALLAWLKTLIQKNISQIQNLSWESKNQESIIYALQIFWNLSGFPMKIDWVYNNELDNKEFKQKFLETKTQKSSIWEKLWIPMERFKDSKNLWEFVNITIETVIKKYAQKLSSPEWIPLKTSEIHKEIVVLLQEIDKKLPVWNIYKWKTDLIINNFLTPKENGEKLIKSAIDYALSDKKENKETTSEDIDIIKTSIKWTLWTLIDLSKTESPEKIQKILKEIKIKEIIESNLKDSIKKNPELKKMINELDKIFDLIISLSKTLDKKELFTSIDNFFDNNSWNILKIANKKPNEAITDKVKLQIVNDWWKIVDWLITKERVDIWLKEIWKFDFLKENKIMSQVIDIINNWKLNSNDKLVLFKELSKLVLETTNPNANKIEQSNNIKKSLNSIAELLSKFNKEWKIDEQKIVTLVKEFMNSWEKSSVTDKISRLKNITDFWTFMKDNYEILYNMAIWEVKWWDWVENAIKEFIRNYKLSENISKAWWELIERLEKAFNLNAADMILSIRKTLLESDKKENNLELSKEKKDEVSKAAYDIWSVVVDKISKRWLELIKSKLDSNNPNQKKLTKEEIINSVFQWIWDIFKDEKVKNNLFENAKKLWARIDNKEVFIQNLVTHFLNNPEFKVIINNVSTILLSRIWNSKDVSAELDKIKNDINKLTSDFTKNYKKESINWVVKTFNETQIIDEKSKWEIVSTSVNIVYDYIKNPKNVAILIQAFPEIKSKLPAGISEEKTINIITNFLNAIPKELVWKIILEELKPWFDINEFKNIEKISSIFNKIIQNPSVNKDAILQTIIDAELGKVKTKEGNEKQDQINKETLWNWIDTLYTLLENADSKKIKELTTSLWLDNIFATWIETALKNIPKETLKSVLSSNMKILNWNFDINNGLKFTSELYEKLPVWNRLNIIDDLVSNIWWTKKEWWDNIKIDSQNAKYITNLLYATVETWDSNKLLNIVSKVSPELHKILKSPSLLWNNTLENGLAVLKSVPKDKFQNFLITKNEEINNLVKSWNEWEAIKLVVSLLWEVNTNELKANLSKDKTLSKNENWALDMASSVQKSIEKNKEKIGSLVTIWQKIEKHMESKESDITKSWLTQNELKIFSENLFDVVSDTMQFELQNTMEKNNLTSIDEARKLLADKFEIPESNGDSKIDMSKISMLDFVANNLWFSLSWWISYIFKWKDFTIKNAWIDYFANQSRKWDFSRIVTNYFS